MSGWPALTRLLERHDKDLAKCWVSYKTEKQQKEEQMRGTENLVRDHDSLLEHCCKTCSSAEGLEEMWSLDKRRIFL